jgi:peptide deformylase
MSIKKIIELNNPLLRKKSKAIRTVDNKIKQIVSDMKDTMYFASGCGLAAIQIGEPYRIILVDTTEERKSPLLVINPRIIKKEGEIIFTEGCLSVPGLEGDVKRYEKVVVSGKDINFQDIEIIAEGYTAVAFQHEIDHLDGKIYIEKAINGTVKSVIQDSEK